MRLMLQEKSIYSVKYSMVIIQKGRSSRAGNNIADGVYPKDTAYMRWSCHSGMAKPVQIASTPPAPSNGGTITVFWASQLCGPAGWLVLLFIKVGDVKMNPFRLLYCVYQSVICKCIFSFIYFVFLYHYIYNIDTNMYY